MLKPKVQRGRDDEPFGIRRRKQLEQEARFLTVDGTRFRDIQS
jgi:hypothetical protein